MTGLKNVKEERQSSRFLGPHGSIKFLQTKKKMDSSLLLVLLKGSLYLCICAFLLGSFCARIYNTYFFVYRREIRMLDVAPRNFRGE